VRQKVAAIFAREPNARQEAAEANAARPTALSKHQKFMHELSTSGKSLAEIQTTWHNYYVGLPDSEKHAVWQEFYENNAHNSRYQTFVTQHNPTSQPINPNMAQAVVADHTPAEPKLATKPNDRRTVADIKRQIVGRASAGGKLTAKHHLQSLLFGLGMGVIVLIITLFSFFNEYIIAPFIQPSRHVSATPIIVGTDGVAASSTPEVIIPKINVEIPLNFSVTTTNESQIENALEDGIVHYPTTVLPGQKGNTAFFGHSSNNIFNPGKYKFAFVLLHELVPGDTFYLTYNNKVYAYQVYDKQIVDPGNVSVLNNVDGKTATATLITCDPPGTSLHRLVVWGEQVSPNPNANSSGLNTSTTTATQLPNNGPSLWSRLIHSIF
jgi:sortase A